MFRVLLLALVASISAETLIFQDEFDEFDLSRWEHEKTAGGGGNWEFQYYSNNRSNSYVKNGILYLKPTLTADTIGEESLSTGYTLSLWGAAPASLCTGNAFFGCERVAGAGGNIIPPIQSARIRTTRSLNFKYGRVEIRAKLPKGDWLWPAMWLMPTYNQYGEWPASGEIDLVESRGNLNYPGGVKSFESTLHWGPFYPEDPFTKTHAEYTLPSGTFNDDFNVFGMYWSQDGLYTYLNNDTNRVLDVKFDQSFWSRGGWDRTQLNNPWNNRTNAAPFDQKFYLILNVAVGGTNPYFKDGVGGKPWTSTDPHAVNTFWKARNSWLPTWKGEDAALQVDYIRVWQQESPSQV